ncbi:outer membrane protein assembly factor BamB family protein [Tenacibaculum discolor]|uniref:outer membrane protein assembly factor BamB family protein n=1 Tax=Tenacibaculum discolor TaxID=361581 RepID=UPI000EAFED7E|nr:PQQ-binding-like beta-propeller repeat protein [Tenacibaculum discolor]RLK06829.1 PQQ enzyme-like repeat protein [Tenacibaculum discolor]
MKTKLFLLFLLTSLLASAQKAPDHTLTLDSKISDVYLHNLTGIPVVTTDGAVYGVNGETGQKIWEFKESGFIKNLNALGQDGGSSFSEVALSPFGKFDQTIFNIKTGHKILDEKTNGYKGIFDNKFVFGKNAILFFAKTDKTEAKLFLTSIENDNIIWESYIKTNKKLGSLLLGGAGAYNFIQNEDKIAFTAGKTVFLINKSDGKVILSEKYDAGKLFFTEDNKSLIAVENKSSSLVGGAIKAGFTMGLSLIGKKVIGKELIAFDVNSGKEAWKKPIKLDEGFVDYQFEDGKLFLIHEDGAKLFDYHTGKEAWKKEFKRKKVKGIEKTDEGYIVYYKNKKHLVDNTGKKVWKRPQKVIKNVDFEVDDEEEFTTFSYDKGTIFVTPYRIEYFENGKEKRIYKINLDGKSDKLTFDKKNNNLILLSKKRLYILNPDKGLGKDQVKKIDFHNKNDINLVEPRDNGYFINGNWEYVMVNLEGNLIKKEYFKQPGEGLRHLKNIGSAAIALNGMASQVSGVTNAAVGGTLYSTEAFVGEQNLSRRGSNLYDKGYNQYQNGQDMIDIANKLWDGDRYNAFKGTKNNAFFYANKGGKKVLVQVNKDSGDTVETYEFGIDKPKYKIDKPAKKIYFSKGKDLKIFSYN